MSTLMHLLQTVGRFVLRSRCAGPQRRGSVPATPPYWSGFTVLIERRLVPLRATA